MTSYVLPGYETPITVSTATAPEALAHVFRWLQAKAFWHADRSEAEFQEQIKRASAVFTLTQAGASEPLGFARCAGDATRIAYVSDVYLAEHLQGQGLGRVFLQHVFDHGGRWKWRYLLHAEESTARWYERAFGFTIVGRSPVSERLGREIMLCERLPLLEETGVKVDGEPAEDTKA